MHYILLNLFGTVIILSRRSTFLLMYPLVRMHPVVWMQRIVFVGSSLWILTKNVWAKRFNWHNPSHMAWPWWWIANNFEKTTSLPQKYVCVGCQLNSDRALRLLCFETTCQSTWLDAVTWPVDKKRVNQSSFGVLNHLFERVEQPKKWPKNPRNAFFNVLLTSSFKNLRLEPPTKNLARTNFETVLCAVLIHDLSTELNRDQRFSEVTKLIRSQRFWETFCKIGSFPGAQPHCVKSNMNTCMHLHTNNAHHVCVHQTSITIWWHWERYSNTIYLSVFFRYSGIRVWRVRHCTPRRTWHAHTSQSLLFLLILLPL